MIDLLFYVKISIVYSTIEVSLDFQTKLNVHAARDGTAAGLYGGAPREHLIFFKELYLVCT